MPHHGVFVWERLKAYLGRHGGEAVVIAPVPYVPGYLARGEYARYHGVPYEEERDGVRVLHPRYLLLPKVSMSVAPLSLALRCRSVVARLLAGGQRFDLIDAHYLYPDGVAAGLLARWFSLPLVVTARGTDVNLIPEHAVPRAWLRWLLRRVDGAVAVADALRRAMAPLHPAELTVDVLRNGVDLVKFAPLPQAEARAELGWEAGGKVVLSVGHLIERKGHHHAIAALRLLPGVRLKVVGEGPWRERLQQLAAREGVRERVEFTGALPHAALRKAYAAADVLTLLSSREGWPNVLLESMACGTPVVASAVFGAPEIVREDAVGELVDSTRPEAVAAALGRRLGAAPDRGAIRAFAERHSWDEVADGMHALFQRARRRGR